MKKSLVLSIVFLVLSLISCSGSPTRYLASEACLVHKGLSTRDEIYKFLGPPDRVIRHPDGTEDWYYYQVRESTLKKFPLLSRLAEEEIEILRITFRGDRAIDCVYYVKKR